MANNYDQFVQQIPLQWLCQGPIGQKYWAQIAALFDNNTNTIKSSVLASFPDFAPSDGLQYLGREFGILQGISETDDDFRYRMRRYWNAWKFTGTALGVLTQLWFQGYQDAYCVQQNGLIFNLTNTPDISNDGDLTSNLNIFDAGLDPMVNFPNFTFGDTVASTFAIILPTIPATWTDIQVPPTNISAPTISELNVILNSVIQWKPAKATFLGLFVMSSTTWMIGFPVRSISAPPGSPNQIGYNSGTIYFIPPITY